MARLQEFYKSDVAPALMKKFGYKSPMQIPRLEKVVVNVGAGDAKDNAKAIDSIIDDLTTITGQKAVPTTARKSVSNFKLVRVCTSVQRSRFAAIGCTNLWISSSRLRFRASETLRASIPIRSTAAAIIPAGLRSSLFFRRSSTIRSIKSEAWIFAS